MGHLKKENVSKCVSVLKEFIDGAQAADSRKGIAVLALKQLQFITAGTDIDDPDPSCEYKPRAGFSTSSTSTFTNGGG